MAYSMLEQQQQQQQQLQLPCETNRARPLARQLAVTLTCCRLATFVAYNCAAHYV